MRIDLARRVIADAIAARIFPAAALEVGSSGGVLAREALGTLTFDGTRPAAEDTVFDLASLTKPIATTTVAMELLRTGQLGLDEPLRESFLEWRGADRAHATVRDLLEHASGLPARLLDAPPRGRREFEHDICTMPLEYAPRSQSIYSDLGFILLGFLVADRTGRPLDAQFREVMVRLRPDVMVRLKPDATDEVVRLKPDTTDEVVRLKPDTTDEVVRLKPDTTDEMVRLKPDATGDALAFGPVVDAAPTMPMDEDVRRGRLLTGEVHDNYAAALGGVAGHAGLFGSAPAVGAFAQAMLRAARGDGSLPVPWTPTLVAQATAKSAVPRSSRALGWDTMLPTSSCGTRMSASAFGHVGFTGTSLWIDPARDRYFVLLTNRACGGGTLDQMREVRRAFHDALASL